MAASEQGAHKKALLKRLRRLVVKIGSSSISGSAGLDRERMASLVDQLAAAHERGIEVVVVTSGAVAAGATRVVGPGERPKSIPQRQAAAAVGQIDLMSAYGDLFGRRGKVVAQVLLSHDDLAHRQRYINAKHTLHTLLSARVVPIANENDTVAVEELNFGDNDNLSSLVATLVDADLLVILSDVAGLFDRDPRLDSNARLIPLLHADEGGNAEISAVTGPLGRGGMAAKIAAARKASAAGIATVIADSRRPDVLHDILEPDLEVGTLILPGGDRLSRRKHWIAFNLRPTGSLIVDQGAYDALRRNGGSLLPKGLREVRGRFRSGACVRCLGPDGQEFARGLVSYSAAELEQIKGLHSTRIEEVLGYKISDEVIHRDDLALLGAER